jgi:hypothetical protein
MPQTLQDRSRHCSKEHPEKLGQYLESNLDPPTAPFSFRRTRNHPFAPQKDAGKWDERIDIIEENE